MSSISEKNPNPDKSSIRATAAKGRKSRTVHEYETKSRTLSEHLTHFCINQGVGIIHTFLPMTGRGEPDISHFIGQFLARGGKVMVPEVVKGELEMNHHWFGNDTVLKDGTWGVSVPAESAMADPTAAQMVIVPMLAVDRRGFRVGYGKGYYDYFLSRMDTVTVGVCFGDEIVDWVPNEAHDVPVQYIATENGVISAAK